MKAPFLILLSFVSIVRAQGVAEVQLRSITFEMSGTAASFEALEPGCDEKLYASLTARAAAGTAKIVQDQTINIRGGQRSKVESLREFPYPTELHADLLNWSVLPGGFNVRRAGQTMEGEATTGDPDADDEAGFNQRMIDLNIAPEICEPLPLHAWPVPDFRGAGQMGKVLRPLMAVQQSTMQMFTCTGLTTLVSVVPGPRSALSSPEVPSFRYTFIRAGLRGETPAKPAAARTRERFSMQRRLHSVTIRLPRDEAATLLLQHGGDDAAFFAGLSRRVTGGTAQLTGHSALIVRGGQRSRVESSTEFPVPAEWKDLIPEKWSAQTHGEVLEAEGTPGDDRLEPWTWNQDQIVTDGPEMTEYHPDARRPDLYGVVAEQVVRRFNGRSSIPASGILLKSAISTTAATEDVDAPEGTAELCFLLQSPPSARAPEKAQPQYLLQALVVSVPASEGSGLAGKGMAPDTGRAAALIRRLASGNIHAVCYAAVTLSSRQRPSVSCQRNVMQPRDFHPSAATPELKLPASWKPEMCGSRFECELSGMEGGHLILHSMLQWDSAPVLPLGEPGAEVPKMEDRRCQEEVYLKDFHLAAGKPVIAEAHPSHAREGTPEYGKWHVLILKAAETTPALSKKEPGK